MARAPNGNGPRALTPQLFGQLMDKAVPLDRTGDERIIDLLGQLKDERDRRARKEAHDGRRH